MKVKIRGLEILFPDWVYTLVFLPIAIYFRFIGGTWLVISNNYDARLRNLIFVSAIFLFWVFWKIFFDRKLISTGLEIYLVLFIIVLIITVFHSDNFDLSLQIALDIVALILAIYLLLDIKSRPLLWDRLLDAVLITGGFNLLLILVRIFYWFDKFDINISDVFTQPLYVVKVLPRLPDLVNFNANVTAVYLLILIPICIYKLVSAKRNGSKIMLAGIIFFAGIVLLLTQSRGVFVGLFFAAGTYILTGSDYFQAGGKRRKSIAYLLLGFTIIIAVTGGFYVFVSRGPLLSASVLGRIEGWRIAWEIIKSNPLLGTGLGTYGEIFLNLRDPEIYPLLNLHAHNELLNVITNIGFVGLSVVLFLLYKYIKILRINEYALDWERRSYLLSLSGFLGMGLVDSFLDSNNIALLVVMLLVGLLPVQNLKEIYLTRKIAIGMIGALLVLAIQDSLMLWKLFPYTQTIDAAKQEDWHQAEVYINEALQRDSRNKYYQFSKAQIIGQYACKENKVDLDLIGMYKESMGIFNSWGPIHENLAALYATQGMAKDAEEQILLAILLDPRKAENKCLLGDYLLHQDKQEEAISVYGRCLNQDPDLLDTPYWQSDQTKILVQEQVINWVVENRDPYQTDSNLNLARLMMLMNNFEAAEIYLSPVVDQNITNLDAMTLYAELLFEENEVVKALRILNQIVEREPRYYQGWTLLSKIYYETGNYQEGLHAVEISLAIKPEPETLWISGNLLLRLGQVDDAMDRYKIAVIWKENTSVLTQWTVRRFPIPEERLSCLPGTSTYSKFYDLARAGINDLCYFGFIDQAEELFSLITAEVDPEFANNFEKIPCLTEQ